MGRKKKRCTFDRETGLTTQELTALTILNFSSPELVSYHELESMIMGTDGNPVSRIYVAGIIHRLRIRYGRSSIVNISGKGYMMPQPVDQNLGGSV